MEVKRKNALRLTEKLKAEQLSMATVQYDTQFCHMDITIRFSNLQAQSVSRPPSCVWAYKEYEKGNIFGIINKKLPGEDIDMVQVERALQVSFWCIQEQLAQRPSMGKVVQVLEGIMDLERPTPPKSSDSFLSTTTGTTGSGSGVSMSMVSTVASSAHPIMPTTSPNLEQEIVLDRSASTRNRERVSRQLLSPQPYMTMYLIVIDDVWKEETWRIINYALVKNSKHSRIITTTRMYDVAEACCSSEGDVVHKMKPLDYEDSKRLFLNRVFGSEEDSVIAKGRLVRRWIAEGFIQEEEGNTLYELGERCFNELINRSLIQARKINLHGEVRACQVHDTILDFIVLKSEEENFVTLFGDGYQMPSPRSNKFYFLRVLDLQGCRQVKSDHLAAIGDLLQLKHLSLCETGRLSYRMGSITALEDLDCVDISKQSIDFIRELGQLTNLRRVSFILSSANCSDAKKFEVEDILVLGRLPALVFLQLVMEEWFEATRLTIRGCDGFYCLRQFVFSCNVPVMFEVGAMPNLENLTLTFSFTSLKIDKLLVSNGDFPFGIQYLSSLDSLHSVVSYVGIPDWIGEKSVQMEKKGFSTGKES
ncbi:hypothetical protein BAE44_0019366 [Dichanthelium oligosanthes]|uniref:Uncharacterized protein n=1 Tax=Dichanthelium oligosanthes TaxID=888268 RepID=A0A1E5V3N5_9POAL|nr:hypothetical protein BAE44_0019366 [Dichanthelium oligosanthes]